MQHRSFRIAGTILLAAAAAVGCTEHTGSPTSPAFAPAQAEYQVLRGPVVLDVLNRAAPLRQDVAATATIGAAGGEIRLTDAGVTIRFEPGAVRKNTRITAVAPAGRLVVYEFEPHGLRFDAPVWIIQDIEQTAFTGPVSRFADLEAGYFPTRDLLDAASGRAQVSELMRVDQRADRTLAFQIRHFSGYVLSTGRVR